VPFSAGRVDVEGAGYNLTKTQHWTETEATNFIQAAIPTCCPNLWG
jgi:hypothetical protein